MANPVLVTILAYAHILSAIGWLGGGMLTAFVVGPSLQSLQPGSRLEFVAKSMPKIVRYIEGMIAGTLVFGLLLLYTIVGGDFSALAPSTPFGMGISAGMTLALITAILVFAVTVPAFQKMISLAGEALKTGGPPSQDFPKVAKRARMSSIATSVLLLLVLVFMVSAGFY